MEEKLSSTKALDDVVLNEGTFDLLLRLNEGPKSFIELKEGRHSPNTVLSRLRRLQKINVVQTKLLVVKKGRRPRIKYTLTTKGKKLLKRYMPIKADYLEIRDVMKKLKEQISVQKQAIKILLSSTKEHKKYKHPK